jgi:glycosyltransferase involved in cell wall biosynthesis
MPDFELLLVVNGEKADQIAADLESRYASDSRVRVVATAMRQLNFSLSLGLHLARAPFVARMDADDVAAPDRLQQQLARMQANPALAVLGSWYHLIDQHGEVVGMVEKPVTDAEIRRQLPFKNPLCHPSVMLRKAPILAVGGYLGGQHAEDYDLWARLSLVPEWQFENSPLPVLDYNAAPDGPARGSRQAYANMAGAQFRNFIVSRRVRWLLGSVVTSLKSLWARR